MRTWRNWYTLTIEVRMPKGLEVQVLSCAQIKKRKILFGKISYSRYRKILLSNTISQFCLMCKEKDVRVLAVHHIDQDHTNQNIENLAWLCHNCYHLAHHDSVSKQKLSKVLILQGMATIV